MARKLSPETLAIIGAIEAASATTKSVSDAVARELGTHTKHDDERFTALTNLVTSIATDVKSLLDSRSFQRGAWWAMIAIAGGVSTVVGFLVSWMKH
jgi:hypothetical protein